jgi:hypothetical protein
MAAAADSAWRNRSSSKRDGASSVSEAYQRINRRRQRHQAPAGSVIEIMRNIGGNGENSSVKSAALATSKAAAYQLSKKTRIGADVRHRKLGGESVWRQQGSLATPYQRRAQWRLNAAL